MKPKLCKTCNQIKALELFPKQHTVKSGYASNCKECASERNRRRYEQKKEQILNRHRKWREENKEAFAIMNREYAKKAYRKNKALRNHITRKYQASKAKRVPKWLTPIDLWIIKEIYHLAEIRTKATGFEWQVDHIIPLQGQYVSGLHVPNNLQVIPKTMNIRKSNKY